MRSRFVITAILVLALVSGYASSRHSIAAGAEGERNGRVSSRADATNYEPDDEECAFVFLINQFRADNGKEPLVLLSSLGAAADHKARDMADRNYFGHTEPPAEPGGDTTSFSENISDFGYTGSGRGENLAAGYASAQATFNQWERSPSHRANMLGDDIDFKAMGVGRAFNPESDYGWYWTNTFGSSVSGDIVSCGDPSSHAR